MHEHESCIFCQIVRGDAPSFNVYEDPLTLVFMDIFPISEGHTLVVPKEHCENIFEIGAESMTAAAGAARRVAHAVRKVFEPDGLAVYQANGSAAGQTVFHYHTHLIPRSSGKPFTFQGHRRGEPARLQEIAATLTAAITESK